MGLNSLVEIDDSLWGMEQVFHLFYFKYNVKNE